MTMRIWALAAFGCLYAFAAFAQTSAVQPAPPPTDLELEQARAAMLQTQLQYFVFVLRRNEAELQKKDADEKVIAAWWASYVAGLRPQQ